MQEMMETQPPTLWIFCLLPQVSILCRSSAFLNSSHILSFCSYWLKSTLQSYTPCNELERPIKLDEALASFCVLGIPIQLTQYSVSINPPTSAANERISF